ISTYCIQMIGTIVLARLLIPDDFGLVAMVTVFSAILIEFGILRLTDATIQREKINHKQISTLFWINFILCTALALLLMVLSPVIAGFYKEPRLQSITIAISLGFVFTGLSTQHLALLQRNMEFHKFAANQIFATTISTVVAIILALQGWKYWAIVARQITLPMVIAAGAWLLCRWRPGLPSSNSGVWPMLKFGLNNLGNYTTSYLTRSLDKLLLGWQYGAQALGHYDRAYQLFVMPVNQLTYPLTSVAVATLSRLCNEPERYRTYYLKAVSMIAFVGMGLSMILTLIGNDFILLLLGPQWTKAGRIFTVFGPGIGIMLVYGTHGWLHLSLGRPDRWFRWGIFALIITALLFVIGLPFGPLGVAVAYTVSFYVLIGPGLWYAGSPIELKVSAILSVTWKYFLAALISGLLSWYILYNFEFTSNAFSNSSLLLRLFISSALCTSIYLLFVIVIYQNTKPISQFISILGDVLPNAVTRMFQRK
ncbi:MAG: lipopolysaccharide biosynthesis protein, partial [Anaerolineaceae bacterium]|nr:lipopolysaccharide biosynthesis protein [Anaerolineaceae bacterium]